MPNNTLLVSGLFETWFNGEPFLKLVQAYCISSPLELTAKKMLLVLNWHTTYLCFVTWNINIVWKMQQTSLPFCRVIICRCSCGYYFIAEGHALMVNAISTASSLFVLSMYTLINLNYYWIPCRCTRPSVATSLSLPSSLLSNLTEGYQDNSCLIKR